MIAPWFNRNTVIGNTPAPFRPAKTPLQEAVENISGPFALDFPRIARALVREMAAGADITWLTSKEEHAALMAEVNALAERWDKEAAA